MTSDERREVAKRLRDDNPGYGTEYDFFLHALGMPREGRGPCDWDKVHKRLADLINPTCVPEAHNYGSIVGNACPRCGWSVAGYMRYCPGCGARVVSYNGN